MSIGIIKKIFIWALLPVFVLLCCLGNYGYITCSSENYFKDMLSTLVMSSAAFDISVIVFVGNISSSNLYKLQGQFSFLNNKPKVFKIFIENKDKLLSLFCLSLIINIFIFLLSSLICEVYLARIFFTAIVLFLIIRLYELREFYEFMDNIDLFDFNKQIKSILDEVANDS
ncbi:MAG: hypothetical protein HRT47_04175 [Candidatus Caenarcaniphilales bacterium]|nr:hypothetical protein [Candidatus Caenarcaniphilales bacterium]